MLLPKAMKFVADRRGGAVTVTMNVHASVRCAASMVVQATVEAPSGNTVPLGGEQVVRNGGSPAMTCGGS